MFADPSAAAEVNAVARLMERMLTEAMHDGEPSADELAIARVIGDVWLSNLVAWVTRRASANDVSQPARTGRPPAAALSIPGGPGLPQPIRVSRNGLLNTESGS